MIDPRAQAKTRMLKVTPLGGGVTIHANRALESANLLADDKQQVSKARASQKIELAAGQWWWD